MPSIQEALERLFHSVFRSRFRLKGKYLLQARQLWLEKLREHAVTFVRDKFSATFPANDGRQTLLSGYSAFLAMHGCAMCRRGFMNKWWHVSLGVPLHDEQQTHAMNFLLPWVEECLNKQEQ